MNINVTFNKGPFDIEEGNTYYCITEGGYLYCIQSEVKADGNNSSCRGYVKCFPILDKKEKAKILLTHSLVK